MLRVSPIFVTKRLKKNPKDIFHSHPQSPLFFWSAPRTRILAAAKNTRSRVDQKKIKADCGDKNGHLLAEKSMHFCSHSVFSKSLNILIRPKYENMDEPEDLLCVIRYHGIALGAWKLNN